MLKQKTQRNFLNESGLNPFNSEISITLVQTALTIERSCARQYSKSKQQQKHHHRLHLHFFVHTPLSRYQTLHIRARDMMYLVCAISSRPDPLTARE